VIRRISTLLAKLPPIKAPLDKILVNTTNCLVDRYFSPTVRTGRAVNRHKTILICIFNCYFDAMFI
jgi:hypothetical protein